MRSLRPPCRIRYNFDSYSSCGCVALMFSCTLRISILVLRASLHGSIQGHMLRYNSISFCVVLCINKFKVITVIIIQIETKPSLSHQDPLCIAHALIQWGNRKSSRTNFIATCWLHRTFVPALKWRILEVCTHENMIWCDAVWSGLSPQLVLHCLTYKMPETILHKLASNQSVGPSFYILLSLHRW